MNLSVFGIRHHGCGSARSTRAELARLAPDVVLIEGAPEANEILHLAASAEMQPPAAILIYAPDEPKKAVYYPFAEFSPEWQAMQYALKQNVLARFIDLPQAHQLAESERRTASGGQSAENQDDNQLPRGEGESESHNLKSRIRRDPLQFAAEAAGFADGEIWWESLIETRAAETDLFGAILELMTALRDEAAHEISDQEIERDCLREAFMRQEIRRAVKEGYENIAVVCGAWHAPVLTENALEEFAKTDAARLKNLKKIKLAATWIPYTYNRLSFQSGYGAGVSSPEFYHQIWQQPDSIAAVWLARAANLLRAQDLDASSASVIEAVRLAESLAAMRGLAAVGLTELFDAVRACLCFGDDAQLRLIHEKLIVGERLGAVPAATPHVPLQLNLQVEQKRLRLPAEAMQKTIELDLRKPNDLGRSQLLHRLNLLEINWGQIQPTSSTGTFKEAWRLQWQPEFELAIIEANVWGNRIADAATNKICDIAAKSEKLADLTALVGQTLLSNLPAAIEFLMRQVAAQASVSSDVPTMMDALPALADVLRYGNVRNTDRSAVAAVVDGLAARICIGLPNASAALDDDAAEQMFVRIQATDNAFGLLQNSEHSREWHNALGKLAAAPDLHGLIAGRATRLLFDAGKITATTVEQRLGLATSTALEPAQVAAWLDGFLRGSALVLLHNPILLKTLDVWVTELKENVFVQTLPVLRRTFATFHQPERRRIGEQLKAGSSNANNRTTTNQLAEDELDVDRANQVLPLLSQLLGLKTIGS